jgi:hypothetical protein
MKVLPEAQLNLEYLMDIRPVLGYFGVDLTRTLWLCGCLADRTVSVLLQMSMGCNRHPVFGMVVMNTSVRMIVMDNWVEALFYDLCQLLIYQRTYWYLFPLLFNHE